MTMYFLMKDLRERQKMNEKFEAKVEKDMMRYSIKESILKGFLKMTLRKFG